MTSARRTRLLVDDALKLANRILYQFSKFLVEHIGWSDFDDIETV